MMDVAAADKLPNLQNAAIRQCGQRSAANTQLQQAPTSNAINTKRASLRTAKRRVDTIYTHQKMQIKIVQIKSIEAFAKLKQDEVRLTTQKR
ncbi:Uncharacterized protein HZ326_6483 [Fusarium oxysporum f. sp. albedinis]|nr:Uncharacterized protein HZ326_6483 [Fusarium oxysporum f. sp. albedinis]